MRTAFHTLAIIVVLALPWHARAGFGDINLGIGDSTGVDFGGIATGIATAVTTTPSVDTLDTCVPTGAEVCDGTDNDCDKEIDEGGVCSGTATASGSDTATSTGSDTATTTDTATVTDTGTATATETGSSSETATSTSTRSGEGKCGNGTLNSGEACDDGNTTNGDGCSAICEREIAVGTCGDGTIDRNEQCDDGNNVSGDNCSATCEQETPSGTVDTSTQTDTCTQTPEVCDGADNDCNGVVDEGTNQECYEGPTGTQGVGICTPGKMACTNGAYGECVDDVLPAEETCDGTDNDCDGQIDEGTTNACGQCGDLPVEVCDGQDNDCDGQTDEATTKICYPGPADTKDVGLCQAGTKECGEPTLIEGTNEYTASYGSCKDYVIPAEEVCDGLDNDCDGVTDEGCDCIDGDTEACGETEGACEPGAMTCRQGQWSSCENAVMPSAEVCDGTDNDCDGQIDEETTSACYDGPDGTEGVGTCQGGEKSCTQVTSGEYTMGECTGQVLPVTESCNGIDDDCDGVIDPGCDCTDGASEPCGRTDEGACELGTRVCSYGQWGECENYTGPSQERCDGVDNNCDGITDEDLSRTCYDGAPGTDGVGLCAAGTQLCSDSAWGSCDGQVVPSDEACDSVDNDCDGTIDEGCDCVDGQLRPCGEAVGACQAGTETCDGGKWGECIDAVGPEEESCNGRDDDCDGITDEDGDGQTLSQGCYSGAEGTENVGICRGGKKTCTTIGMVVKHMEAEWGSCIGEVTPTPDTCDGFDNDCDGTTDEGCDCVDGERRDCGDDTGECQKGEQICAGGTWGDCADNISARDEGCDNIDNDCDGDTDEGLTESCYGGPEGTAGVGDCHSGTRSCVAGMWPDCSGEVGPVNEVCEGSHDEDCDGTVDEDCECLDGQTRACGSTEGACEEGTQTCSTGVWGECSGGVTATTEACDGSDNDCDGTTDEDCDCIDGEMRIFGTDTGACEFGAETCESGQWVVTSTGIRAGDETCNGSDDDCDGDIDEDLVETCYSGAPGTSGVGACQSGTETCSAGSWGACSGEITPESSDTCGDEIDNDCDGVAEEDCECEEDDTRECGEDTGACVMGTQRCENGAWSAECSGATVAATESCNGIDDDCDGLTDEPFDVGQSCEVGVGACMATGRQACLEDGSNTACNAVAGTPGTEICGNNIDDDCDGVSDEDCTSEDTGTDTDTDTDTDSNANGDLAPDGLEADAEGDEAAGGGEVFWFEGGGLSCQMSPNGNGLGDLLLWLFVLLPPFMARRRRRILSR